MASDRESAPDGQDASTTLEKGSGWCGVSEDLEWETSPLMAFPDAAARGPDADEASGASKDITETMLRGEGRV